MEKPFIHLHNHSDFSLLDGSASVKGLAALAKEFAMPALALTDHGNMLGALYFEKACLEAGVKPIFGCEVYVAPSSRFEKVKNEKGNRKYFHMCLLAENETGYHNLLKLTSKAYIEGFYYKPRVDDALLEEYHEGIIATSACLAGEISYNLINGRYDVAKTRALYYGKLFGEDHFYLELQDHSLPQDVTLRREMKKLAAETGLPLVVTNDVHYLRQADQQDNDVFICIGTQSKRSDTQRMKASANCYFRSPDEMYALFDDVPEALSNTMKIAERCNVAIPKPGPKLPEYQIPASYTSEEAFFRYLVQAGLKKRYGNPNAAILERAEQEITTIVSMGFVGYFLIVWDFIDWAKNQKISVGPGRGSGAGSIVAYALRITDIDPLKYNLLFERFLNPERVSMPDFDIDFNDERRGEVIDYVTQKYGSENVAGIVTYSTLKTKAALKDVARVLDIPYADSLAITKAVPNDIAHLTVAKALEASKELQAYAEKAPVYAELFEIAGRVEGLVRGIGMHACGKVIGQSNIVDYVPLVVEPKEKTVITAFESKLIEDCGLVKMDFLGLITLSIIDRTIAMIRKEEPDFALETINEHDKKTFKLFSRGQTAAIFQFESAGMQKILKEVKPESIEDLIALNSLYRPGPMDYIPDFIRGKQNPKSVVYDDPSLAEILKPTYGVIVYQEQVMQVAQIYAGYTLGGADILRRAMGKKKAEEMAKQQSIFVEGALGKGHTEEAALKLFEKLAKFAGYGFNKSHAACYSVLAYQTAYLKTHYPAQFMAANLTKFINTPSSFNDYLDEAKTMGLQILPPDINLSDADFSGQAGQIYYGFLGLKGIGEAAVKEIIEARTTEGAFTSFLDFVEKIPLQSVNKRTVEALIKAGLFDKCEKEHSRGELLANYEAILEWAIKKKNACDDGPSLFDDDEISYPPYHYISAEDLTLDEKLIEEKELLGFYASGHPLDKYEGAWSQLTNLDLGKAETIMANRRYTLVGLIKNIAIRTTKKGDRMATATVEDFRSSVQVIIFSKVLEQYQTLLQENQAVVVSGMFDKSRGEQQLRIDEVSLPDPNMKKIKNKKIREVHLYLEKVESRENLIELRDYISNNHGTITVFMHINLDNDEKIVRCGKLFQLKDQSKVIEQLEAFPNINRVVVS